MPRGLLIGLLAVCAGLVLCTLSEGSFRVTDEARYVREAWARTGYAPQLQDQTHFADAHRGQQFSGWGALVELTTTAFQVLGRSEGAARIVPLAFGLLAILVVRGLGRSLFDTPAGNYAGIVLLTLGWFPALLQSVGIETLFAAVAAMSLAAFWRVLQRPSWRTTLAFAATSAALWFVGGALGFGLPLVGFALYVVASPREVRYETVARARGALIGGAVGGALVALAGGGGAPYGPGVATGLLTPAASAPFFVGMLLVGLSGWLFPTVFLLGSAVAGLRARRQQAEGAGVPDAVRLLWSWLAAAAALFVVSGGKSAFLLTFALVPLALLLGQSWANADAKSPSPYKWPRAAAMSHGVWMTLLALAAGGLTFGTDLLTPEMRRAIGFWLLIATGSGAVISLAALRSRATHGVFAALAVCSALSAAGALRIDLALRSDEDVRPLARSIGTAARPGDEALVFGADQPALAFYLGRAGFTGKLRQVFAPDSDRVRIPLEEAPASANPRVQASANRTLASGPPERGMFWLVDQTLFEQIRDTLAGARVDNLLGNTRDEVLAANRSGPPLATVISPPPPPGAAVPRTLTRRTPLLELRISTHPYHYALLERRTGRELLASRNTAFTINDEVRMVEGVTSADVSRDTLRLRLRLSGIQTAAEARFRFSGERALSVELEAPNGNEIDERFEHRGETLYGLTEHPYANLANRNLERPIGPVRQERDLAFSNARAPFLLSSKGVGLYFQSTAPGFERIAVRGESSFRFKTPRLTYQVLYGPSYPAILQDYNRLAGPAYVPPTWALSSIWWRDDLHAHRGRNVPSSQAQLLRDAEALQRYRIRAGSLCIDRPYGTGKFGWGRFDFDRTFPDPARMVQEANEKGLRLLLWISNRDVVVPAADEKELLVRGLDNASLDLRNPAAASVLRQGLNRFVDLGFRGFKIDRGDSGDTPVELENEMPTYVARIASEALPDGLIIARNAHDTSRRYTAVWNGDARGDFNGLRASVKSALRSGIIGFPAWGSDTGGYLGRTPDQEVFVRWLGFSAYSPLMEVMIGKGRTPWRDHGPAGLEAARAYASTHHDLIPYTRSALWQAQRTGMPVMRALFLEYPDDPRVADLWDQYLYGDGLMVAPVLDDGATARQVYFPHGRWLRYGAATQYVGPRTATVPAPLSEIPVFVREGAIIPRGDLVRANDRWTQNWAPHLRVEVFPARTGSSSFNYTTGEEVPGAASSSRVIRCSTDAGGLTLRLPDLGAATDLEIHCSGLQSATRNNQPLRPGAGLAFDARKRVVHVRLGRGPATVRLTGAKSVFADPIGSGG